MSKDPKHDTRAHNLVAEVLKLFPQVPPRKPGNGLTSAHDHACIEAERLVARALQDEYDRGLEDGMR